MRRSIRGNRILAQPYRELVWLGYLTLPPEAGEDRRLVWAHRLAAAVLSRVGPQDELELRRVFLRRALRVRLMPWTGRLSPVEAMPAVISAADLEFTRELNTLSAPGRAAYALTMLENRPSGQAVEILAGAGVTDPVAAVREVRELEKRLTLEGRAMRRPAVDPTLARIYGRPLYRLRLLGIAALTACTAVVVVQQLDVDRPVVANVPAQDTVARARAGSWRAGTELDLTTWAPRGSLVGDEDLIRRAQRAWGPGRVQLVFAGQIDQARVVLLARPGQVARFTSAEGADKLEVFAAPRTKPDGTSPLKLSDDRYLLPPWVREASVASLSGAAPRWRALKIRDGVTERVAAAGSGRCWQGPVLRLRAPEIAHGMPYTMIDFGRLTLANAYYQPPPPAEINRYGPHELDSLPQGFSAWKALGCAVKRPAGEIESAMAWEFWAGALPEGVDGRWICLRLADTGGGSSVQGVLLGTRKGRVTSTVTASRPGGWDCSRLRRDVVAGVSWKAPSGKRYFVAGGSRRVVEISLDGRESDGRLVTRTTGRTPRLAGVNELGEKVPVLR
ncbi:hypothetical protein [Nonomuraea soli]|uniref:Uncharacterized protein n=1 Tax=Nonomuraea soli TaxID=1032476 RepID=A0A7W0CT16_9ACTN|nr:hypothetical protein [Nonomuraea soli]MBA2896796.1 hypothetical protein [Nonomuraea soli]